MEWDAKAPHMWAETEHFSASVEDIGSDAPLEDRYYWVVARDSLIIEAGFTAEMFDAITACEFTVDIHRLLLNLPLTDDPHQKAIES